MRRANRLLSWLIGVRDWLWGPPCSPSRYTHHWHMTECRLKPAKWCKLDNKIPMIVYRCCSCGATREERF